MRDNKTRLEQWNEEIERLNSIFGNENLHILVRIDAGLELSQFYNQDKFNKSRMVKEVRNLIWNQAVK